MNIPEIGRIQDECDEVSARGVIADINEANMIVDSPSVLVTAVNTHDKESPNDRSLVMQLEDIITESLQRSVRSSPSAPSSSSQKRRARYFGEIVSENESTEYHGNNSVFMLQDMMASIGLPSNRLLRRIHHVAESMLLNEIQIAQQIYNNSSGKLEKLRQLGVICGRNTINEQAISATVSTNIPRRPHYGLSSSSALLLPCASDHSTPQMPTSHRPQMYSNHKTYSQVSEPSTETTTDEFRQTASMSRMVGGVSRSVRESAAAIDKARAKRREKAKKAKAKARAKAKLAREKERERRRAGVEAGGDAQPALEEELESESSSSEESSVLTAEERPGVWSRMDTIPFHAWSPISGK
jgi:hypothetical protein